VPAQHLGRKSLQHLLLGDIPNEMLTLLLVYHIYDGALPSEVLGNAPSNAVRTACNYDNLVLERIFLRRLDSLISSTKRRHLGLANGLLRLLSPCSAM
jgi:hypothetical protein